jgi:hypothetical protein
MKAKLLTFFCFVSWIAVCSCGPIPMPKGAYTDALKLLSDMSAKRSKVKSFRISGRVDHFGQEHRISGKLFLFATLPSKLRIDLLSPFGSSLSVLTVNNDQFALSDIREGRYMKGPAEPCNIARLVRIPLPAKEVTGILVGQTPMIDAPAEISWNKEGFYAIELSDGNRKQLLEIGSNEKVLPLRRSLLIDEEGIVFEVKYDRWRHISNKVSMPHEIRVVMPREKTDLLLRYDDDGVEVNVELPKDAWIQSFPPDVTIEEVTCE